VKSLAAKSWLAVAVVTAVTGLLLFVPAGTLDYWQGWLYLSIYAVGSVLVTGYLLRHDPALLQRRLRGGPAAEKRPAQRIIMLFASIGFVALLVVPALDRRFGWSSVPVVVVAAGAVLVVIGFYVNFVVFRENSFTSATIQVAEGQHVITTGPYAAVRHPMYAGATLYLLGTPLALGSYRGLVPLVLMMPFLLWRIVDEERFLALNLPGYADYQKKVRYRLLPHVW
jgi:protein-S-isoprenylcysteine O-methyltransferase Ste14